MNVEIIGLRLVPQTDVFLIPLNLDSALIVKKATIACHTPTPMTFDMEKPVFLF